MGTSVAPRPYWWYTGDKGVTAPPPPSPCPSEALISVYIGQGGGERPSVNEVFLEYNMGCGLY